MVANENLMDKVVALAKRRGFIFPSSEIYGGLANTYDYGPLGVELKNNIKNLWWNRFVHRRDDIVGIDAALIMNPKVWEASGHLREFSDPLVECKNCHNRYRLEDLLEVEVAGNLKKFLKSAEKTKFARRGIDWEEYITRKLKEIKCPTCGLISWTLPKRFNLMFKTFIGPLDPIESFSDTFYATTIGDEKYRHSKEKKVIEAINEATAATVYLRPETAQAMFVDFKNILDTTRIGLPFGVAQIGKAFRNEITPSNSIFRTREFEIMEIEYFINPEDWERYFEKWRKEINSWLKDIGVDLRRVHEVDIPEGERAHYSKRTIDFEYDYPFGQKELYGLAYRTDFDLRNHEKFSGQDLKYKDPETGKEFWPHVIEPALGVDRTLLVVLLEAYSEEEDRVVLKLSPKLAPYKVAVFPLLANKPKLVNLAREIYNDLRRHYMVAWDDRGNIGKRYYSQDEIGTPYCITVDFESLEDKSVTVRDRDSMEQERVKIEKLVDYLREKLN